MGLFVINNIFTILPFILIALYVIMDGFKQRGISDMSLGLRCYSCGKEIEMSEQEKMNKLINSKKSDDFILCKACKRDDRINILVENGRIHRLNSFKLFFLSRKSDKLLWGILYGAIGLLLIGLVLTFVLHLSGMMIFANIVNTIYWIIMIIRLHFIKLVIKKAL